MAADLILSAGSLALVYALFLRGDPQNANPVRWFAVFPAAFLIIRLRCFVLFGMYSVLIRYISYHNIFDVLKGVTVGSLLLVIFGFLFGFNGNLRSFVVCDLACLVVMLSGLRFGLRFYWEMKNSETANKKTHKVLIFGAGKAGIAACRAMAIDTDNPVEVVGFIDDAPEKFGKRLNGYKVLGNRYDIKALAKLYKVNEIILALSNAHPDELNRIINLCQDAGLRYRIFSSNLTPNNGNRLTFPIRSVALSDVLPLERIHMNTDAVKEILVGKTILLNGSGGALGLELCSQILRLGCNKLVILDRYDAYLNELVSGLLGIFSLDRIVPVRVGSDQADVLESAFRKHRPEMVFQTAMNKYIPFFESNSDDIVRTNYMRTFDLARLAKKFGCRQFVMISSFSATTGGHLVADSLRISELSLQALFEGSACRLIISRICDIIENRGGIVAIIESQIRKQQTVTLPCPEAEACLISKYSAAQFILQTLIETNGTNGGKGVYVCEAGSPIRLLEVASKLAHLYGLKLGDHLAIRYLNSQEKNKNDRPAAVVRLSPTSHLKVKFFDENGVFDAPEKKTALGKFLSPETCHFCPADWMEQTRQLVNLCGADLFRGG